MCQSGGRGGGCSSGTACALAAALTPRINFARRTDGVGLAAPQVGVNKRLMVYNPEGVRGRGVETVLCNPRVVEASAVEDWFEEGCLSFPNIYADVKVRRGAAIRRRGCSHLAQR